MSKLKLGWDVLTLMVYRLSFNMTVHALESVSIPSKTFIFYLIV